MMRYFPREVFEITEMKDGCISKTEPIGFVWINEAILACMTTEEIRKDYFSGKNIILASVSTYDKRSFEKTQKDFPNDRVI